MSLTRVYVIIYSRQSRPPPPPPNTNCFCRGLDHDYLCCTTNVLMYRMSYDSTTAFNIVENTRDAVRYSWYTPYDVYARYVYTARPDGRGGPTTIRKPACAGNLSGPRRKNRRYPQTGRARTGKFLDVPCCSSAVQFNLTSCTARDDIPQLRESTAKLPRLI